MLRKVKLGEVASIVAGQSPESKYYSIESGTPFLQGNRTFGDKFPEIDTYTTKVTKLAKKGDILISVRAPVGDMNIANQDICIGRGIGAICAKDSNNEYLYYNLKNSISNLLKRGNGTTYDAVTADVLSDYDIYIHDTEDERNTNALIFTDIDQKINLNNRISAKLEQMAKRLYDYWFVQFDFPGADGKTYKSNGGKMVWNEELKREIPEGWEVKKLGDLFTTNRGVSYSTATITGDGGIPMINLASFSPDGTYKVSGLKLFTGEYTKEKVLKPFDLVLCNTQQTAIDFTKDIIGKVLLVPDIFEGDITSSHHINTLHVNNEDLKFYLYRLCNTDYFHKYISNYASGTNILGLDFSGVENFKKEIPPAELLAEFAKLMLNIEKKKSEVIKENQKLTAMRDKLLPLLMNGQVVIEE